MESAGGDSLTDGRTAVLEPALENGEPRFDDRFEQRLVLELAEPQVGEPARDLEMADDVFDFVYDRFDGVTWYVQAVLNRLYGRRRDGLDQAAVEDVVRKLIGENSYDYRALVEALPEGSVRLLRAIAREGVATEVTSSAFVKRHGLKAPSSTSESLSRLVEKELVYKTDGGHIVYDRLFGEWLAS